MFLPRSFARSHLTIASWTPLTHIRLRVNLPARVSGPVMNSSSYTMAKSSPFTNAVVRAMRKLYPEELADKSFDNTGLLLEAPFNATRRQKNSVLLTIDLTKAVADEAIQRKDCVVVAYHPTIFRGLKSLTLADTQQQSLLRLAAEGISVYSPHTAVDAAPEGLGSWLADIVTNKLSDSESRTRSATKQAPSSQEPHSNRQYSDPSYPSPAKSTTHQTVSRDDHTRKTIQPSKDGPAGAGIGQLVTFHESQPLTELIERIARGVGMPKGFEVAIPQGRSVQDIVVRTVAMCAGSGGSVFKGVDADLLFTGELSHHEALAATEQGRCVVTLCHSNTERGFLHNVMKSKLLAALEDEWVLVRGEESDSQHPIDGWKDAIEDESVEVEISKADRDPYGIVVLQGS